MKILFVSHSSVIRAHQQKLFILAEKYKHEITLVTPPYWIEGGVKTHPYTGGAGITYITGKTWFPKKMVHIYLNPGSIIKKTKADIVYIEEEPFDFACWQFILAAKKAGIKAAFFTWENISRGHNAVYSYFNRGCISKADAAVAGNTEAKNILLAAGFKKEIVVMPQYGVNTAEFIKKKERKDGEIFNIAFMGRLAAEKGLDLLLRGFSATGNTMLNVAGTGPMEAALRTTADELKIGGRVKFFGHVEREAIPGFLSGMDCLVLPSITTASWKEQFGRVIIESFAAGVPVIGSSSGEIPSVIGGAGLIFQEGSAEELAACLIRLTGDANLYKNLQEKGLQRVKENFTNEILAQKLDDFFRALVKQGG